MGTNIPVVGAPGKVGTGKALDTSPISADDAFVAGASTMEFMNDGHTILLVDNQAATTAAIGFTCPACPKCGDSKAPSTTQAADTLEVYGPFPKELYNDGNGKVQVTLGATTTIYAAAISV